MDKNELYHWKYVKRKRINGKWKYWYDLDSFKRDMGELASDIDTSKTKPMLMTTVKPNAAAKIQPSTSKKQNAVSIGKSATTKALKSIGSKNIDGVKGVFDKAKKWLDNFLEVKEDGLLNKAKNRVSDLVEIGVDKIKDIVDDVKEWADDLIETKKEKEEREKAEAEEKRRKEEAWKEYEKELDKRRAENQKKIDEMKREESAKKAEAEKVKAEAIEELRKETPEALWGELEDIYEFDDMTDELKKHNPMPSFNIKDEYMSKTEDMDMVNPNYDPNSYEYSMNCSYCTLTYEMRRRGYDVEARPANPKDPITIDDIAEYYEGEKIVSYTEKYDPVTATEVMLAYTDFDAYVESRLKDYAPRASEILTKELLSHGEGARGEIDVYWISGGGHSMAWEVENGKVVIRDNQTNTIYRSTFEEAEHHAFDLGSEKEAVLTISDLLEYTYDFYYMRTDNVEINEKEALKRVKNREG